MLAFVYSTPGVPCLVPTIPLVRCQMEDGAVHRLRKASRNALSWLACSLKVLMPRRRILAWSWPTHNAWLYKTPVDFRSIHVLDVNSLALEKGLRDMAATNRENCCHHSFKDFLTSRKPVRQVSEMAQRIIADQAAARR